MPDRPVAGQLEVRAAPDVEIDGRRLRGVIPYDVESRDLGGWREMIDAAALRGAALDDLTLTVEHAGVPLGRYPTTLELEDRSDGAHWSVELPESRADVREAVERGDLRAGSWRMRVARDEWRGDVRRILEIGELRDVAVVSAPAYPSAVVELRSTPEEGAPMPDTITAPPEALPEPVEARSAPEGPGLPVETATASSGRPAGLTDAFRAAGFPGEIATVPYDGLLESRALTVTGGPDPVQRVRAPGVALGFDSRWAWTVFPRIGVDAGTTSVDVLRQSARSLATAANVIRAIDAVTAKPETSSTVEVVAAALKQVATISKGIPNVYLESSAINSIIESDLRLAVNAGLDTLVLTALGGAGFQDPGTNLLDGIRKAITTVEANGYAPDTVILRPQDAEALDLMKATATAGEAVYVFTPGQGAPRTVWTLRAYVAKSAAAPVVVDASAVGRLYISPITLARFEENSGQTNTSTIRLEGHALFNTERIGAAVRLAAA